MFVLLERDCKELFPMQKATNWQQFPGHKAKLLNLFSDS